MSPVYQVPAPKDEPQENSVEVDAENITINLSSPTLIIAFFIVGSLCIAFGIAIVFFG